MEDSRNTIDVGELTNAVRKLKHLKKTAKDSYDVLMQEKIILNYLLNNVQDAPKDDDLRVWWSHSLNDGTREQLYFDVKNLEEAFFKLWELADKEVDDPNVVWNAGGVETYDSNLRDEFEEGEEPWTEYMTDLGIDFGEIIQEAYEVFGEKPTFEEAREHIDSFFEQPK